MEERVTKPFSTTDAGPPYTPVSTLEPRDPELIPPAIPAEYSFPALQTSPQQDPLSFHSAETYGLQSPAYDAPYQPRPISETEKLGYGGVVEMGRKPQRRRRKRIWIIAAVVLLLVVAGASVGGVLGSRKSKSGAQDNEEVSAPTPDSGEETDSESNSKPSTTTSRPSDYPKLPKPTAIASNSGLAAAGFINSQGQPFMRLFFQTSDGIVAHSTFSVSLQKWHRPRFTEAKSKPGSKLAALDWPVDVTILVYYQRREDCLQEWVTYETEDDGGRGESFGICNPYTVAPESGVAVYYPYVVFQGATGGLVGKKHSMEKLEECKEGEICLKAWSEVNLEADAGEESDVALFPHNGGQSVLFRDEDAKIGERRTTSDTGIWLKGPAFTEAPTLPPKSSIATLALAAPNGHITYYALLQDSSTGSITYFKKTLTDSQLTSTNWKGPFTSSVFRFARKGSQIACITPNQGPDVLNGTLPSAVELAKCFFQLEEGQVRQVGVDFEGEWKVDGDILL